MLQVVDIEMDAMHLCSILPMAQSLTGLCTSLGLVCMFRSFVEHLLAREHAVLTLPTCWSGIMHCFPQFKMGFQQFLVFQPGKCLTRTCPNTKIVRSLSRAVALCFRRNQSLLLCLSRVVFEQHRCCKTKLVSTVFVRGREVSIV